MDFILKSGARPGKEPEKVQWKHVNTKWRNPDNKKIYVRIDLLHRKTDDENNGYIIMPNEFVLTLERIGELTRKTEPDDFLFVMLDGSPVKGLNEMFRILLQKEGLRYTVNGARRTLYSLRHTYTTERRRRGASLEILAAQMATNPLMIQQHYYHPEIDKEADKLSRSILGEPMKAGLDWDKLAEGKPDLDLQSLSKAELIQMVRGKSN